MKRKSLIIEVFKLESLVYLYHCGLFISLYITIYLINNNIISAFTQQI